MSVAGKTSDSYEERTRGHFPRVVADGGDQPSDFRVQSADRRQAGRAGCRSAEADPAAGKISDESPVGKALIGHKKGDKVTIEVPNGTLEFKIVEITR